jgi:hypothetical protein
MKAPKRKSESEMTREKLPRSMSSSSTTGFKNGPTVKRIPEERKIMTENASVTHQP